MKILLIASAFLSAVTAFNLDEYSPYKPAGISQTLSCLQDTVPVNKQLNRQQVQYKDIRTGKPLKLSYNQQQRRMYDSVKGKPVDFYINASTGDTISGYGYVVNNYLLMQPDSSYRLDMSRIRSTNNRYYIIENNKELPIDKNWPANRRGRPQRDSM